MTHLFDNSNIFTFSTWNINTDDRKFARKFFPEWSSQNRSNMINEAISLADIIHLQETRKSTDEGIDSFTPITNFLIANGYNVLSQTLRQPDPLNFKCITAYKITKFQLIKNETIYITQTPYSSKMPINLEQQESILEFKNHNFGDVYERSFLITQLMDLSTGNEVYTINIHMSHILESRIAASTILKEYAEKLPSHIKLIIAGDFNSFPDWGGSEQIGILVDSEKLVEASVNLKSPTGKAIPNDITFIPFPYDCITSDNKIKSKIANSESREEILQIFNESCKPMGGKLDHVITSYNLHKVGDAILNITAQGPELNDFSESNVKKIILNNQSPYLPSDHLSITIKFAYSSELFELEL